MTFELAISTMHKTTNSILEMIDNMNVKCNCLIVNQCDTIAEYTLNRDNQKIRIFFTKERGLSRSRNMAIDNCLADIMLISDDDLYFYDNFEQIILEQHKQITNNSIILFNVDNFQKQYPHKKQKIFLWNLGRFSSWQISFKPAEIKEKHIKFNANYGTGSGKVHSGEENIFLSECAKYFKVFYIPTKILKREPAPSSWFNGYDEKFIFDRGAIYYEMYGSFAIFFYFYFIMRNKKKYPTYSIFKIFKILFNGKNEAICFRKL